MRKLYVIHRPEGLSTVTCTFTYEDIISLDNFLYVLRSLAQEDYKDFRFLPVKVEELNTFIAFFDGLHESIISESLMEVFNETN